MSHAPTEIRGEWFVEPEHRVAGVLRIEKDQPIRLELTGSLLAEPTFDLLRFDRVKGEGLESEDGAKATLEGVFLVRREFQGSGPLRETYVANRGLVGARHVDEGTLASGVRIRSEALSDWLGMALLRPRPNDESERRFTFSSGEGHLRSEIREHRGTHRRVREEISTLDIVTRDGMGFDAWHRSLLFPVHNLLTLVLGQPALLERVWYLTDDGPFRLLHTPLVVERGAPQRGLALLPFDRLADRLGELVDAWFSLDAALRSFMGVFFSQWYAPPRFADLRFELALRSLMLLARGRVEAGGAGAAREGLRAAISGSGPLDQVAEYLVPAAWELHAAQWFGELAMRNSKLLGRTEAEAKQWAERALLTRAYLERRDEALRTAAFSGIELHRAAEDLRRLALAELVERLALGPEVAEAARQCLTLW